MADDEIRFLDTGEALDEVLRMPAALLYKHSTRCGTSLRAMMQVERFSRARPEVPVFGIDVVRHRDLSNEAAGRLGVDHESPQIILVRDGRPAWHTSHSRIKADVLTEALQEEGLVSG